MSLREIAAGKIHVNLGNRDTAATPPLVGSLGELELVDGEESVEAAADADTETETDTPAAASADDGSLDAAADAGETPDAEASAEEADKEPAS